MKIHDWLLPEFDQEMAVTRKLLERCPDAKLTWKPHPKSWTMGQLASHVADTPGWAALTFGGDSFDVAPPGVEPAKHEPPKSQTELLEKFDKNVSDARAAVSAAEDNELMVEWSLLAGGQVIFKMPRVAVWRSMIMNHHIFHRGQLSVYLRLNDIPVPAVYGPSADEQM
jgi:uncharacterized damage-inducible protein DinB